MPLETNCDCSTRKSRSTNTGRLCRGVFGPSSKYGPDYIVAVIPANLARTIQKLEGVAGIVDGRSHMWDYKKTW